MLPSQLFGLNTRKGQMSSAHSCLSANSMNVVVVVVVILVLQALCEHLLIFLEY